MRHISTLLFSALALSLVALAAFRPFSSDAAPPNTNWSQWRGPDGAGISSETNVPTEWGVDKNIKWKTPIAGRGHSQPIVWGAKIFLTNHIVHTLPPPPPPPPPYTQS